MKLQKGYGYLQHFPAGGGTALGGGTLRDIILDSNQLYCLADLSYLWVSILAATIAFLGVRFTSCLYKVFLYIDAFELALFTIIASENTLKLGFTSSVAALMELRSR